MTDEQWEELRPFAEAKAAAKSAFNAWRMSAQPTDLRQREESEVLGDRLRTEMFGADDALVAARKRIIGA